MDFSGTRIGIAVTGSFCTFDKTFEQVEILVQRGAVVTPVFSNASQKTDSRFGRAKEFLERAKELTGREPILTIPKAEPIGPQKLFDLLVIAPCTGNTLAKLANGITDTPVLMAAKAHLRNERPLVIAISSNDALGLNLKNIGLLMNVKHIYFVPFGQDNPIQKPNSMVAHISLLGETIEAAFEQRQYQPVVISPMEEGR